MALLNIFKRKKPEKEKIQEKETKEEKIEKPVKDVAPRARKEAKIGEAYRVLKSPHITEKATDLVEKNQYTFKIWERANKVEVRKAIQDVYGVDVESVKIINIPKKRRRVGRISGWRKGHKKAIVKIVKGQKIEVLPR